MRQILETFQFIIDLWTFLEIKVMKAIIFTFFCCVLYGCCHKIATITIVNNSDSNIFYAFGGNLSQDTLSYKSSNFQLIQLSQSDSYTFSDNHSTFGCNYTSYEVLKSKLSQDTLFMLFINEDTVIKYGFNKVISDWNINARYKLSTADIDLLEYEIPYPPTPEMDYMNIVYRE